MTETAKTAVFVAVAVVVIAVIAVFASLNPHWQNAMSPQDMVGDELFDEFETLDVTSVEILKYDEATGRPTQFEVAQVNDVWSIPSHDNYPADAEEQLAKAVNSVLDLTVLSVASEEPGDHELYGVRDPGNKDLAPGVVGVGTRVVMKGKKGGQENQQLLGLIIGKQDEGQENIYYVRRVGQDPVYTVKVDPGELSTDFGDWIEKDLLKLTAWDIREVDVQDYSFDEVNSALIQRRQMLLKHNDAGDPAWELVKDQEYVGGSEQWKQVGLAENEQLDEDKLRDMRSALDDLKIVDVRRKPKGLSGDLKAETDFLNNTETLLSLEGKGFYPVRLNGGIGLVSNEGETRVTTKEGVQYVLRFGDIAADTVGQKEEKKPEGEQEGEEGDDSKDDGELNRYIFVMAEFNADIIEKPELEPLPEMPAETKEQENTEKAEGEAKADDQNAEKDDADDESNAKADAEKQQKKSAGEIKAERERIEKDNKRKTDEYEKKLEEGRKKVKELNARFADWYYVVSNETYQKIHLGRDEIVKEKKADEDKEEGMDAHAGHDHDHTDADHDHADEDAMETGPLSDFDELKQDGLEE